MVKILGIKLGFRKKASIKPQQVVETNKDVEDSLNTDKVGNTKKADYQVYIEDDMDGIPREITNFPAKRWVDKENFLQYVYNKEYNFMELLPKRKKDLLQQSPEKIQKKIEVVEKALEDFDKNIKKVKDPARAKNKKDVEWDLMKLKAQLHASQWKKCAFLKLGEYGEKKLFFTREGTNFFPIGYDCERNIYGVPSDIRKKSASLLMRNKENKYSKTAKIIEGSVIGMFIISLIFFGSSAYVWFKVNDLYDEAPINQLRVQMLQNADSMSDIALKNAQQTNEILNMVREDLNKPQTIIEGVKPTVIG